MNLLALIVLLVSPFAHADADAWIPNLVEVEPGLYRGMSPPNIQAFTHLHDDLGVKTIVDLEDQAGKLAAEKIFAESKGITVISIPLPGFSTPDDASVNAAIEAIADPANRPVYVHCLHGMDRTGLVVGLYRVERESWSPEDAWSEMKTNGFSMFQYFMKTYFMARTHMSER